MGRWTMNISELSPTFAEFQKLLRVNNRLLVLQNKILLEVHQNQIEDKQWHKYDDKNTELKRMIE